MPNRKRRRLLELETAAVAGMESLVRFLIRDDFNDTVAAGSVNGTLATPGGNGTAAQNTRTATDTGSKNNVGSGVLDFATGATANDAVWWGLITRAAGQILVAKITPADTAGIAQ